MGPLNALWRLFIRPGFGMGVMYAPFVSPWEAVRLTVISWALAMCSAVVSAWWPSWLVIWLWLRYHKYLRHTPPFIWALLMVKVGLVADCSQHCGFRCPDDQLWIEKACFYNYGSFGWDEQDVLVPSWCMACAAPGGHSVWLVTRLFLMTWGVAWPGRQGMWMSWVCWHETSDPEFD